MTIFEKYAGSIPLHLKFRDGILKDISGNDNSPVIVGAPFFNHTADGKGLKFDGVSDNMYVADSPELVMTENFTIFIRMKMPENDGTTDRLFTKGSNAFSVYRISSGNVGFGRDGGYAELTESHIDQKYHVFAFRYNGGTNLKDFEIFVDGYKRTTGTGGSFYALGDGGDIGISSNSSGGTRFKGSFMEIVQIKHFLTDEEIATAYEEIITEPVHGLSRILHTVKSDGTKHDVYIADGKGWSAINNKSFPLNSYISNTLWRASRSLSAVRVQNWGTESKYLQIVAGSGTAIQKVSKQAFGTWEMDFELNNAGSSLIVWRFMWGTSLYYVTIKDTELSINGPSGQMDTIPWVADTDKHTVKITRDLTGLFTVSLDSVEILTATDLAVTNSDRMEISALYLCKVGNFKITPLNY